MFRKEQTLACDGNCQKAFGLMFRPKEEFDPSDGDDYAFLADDELGEAPSNPLCWEGGHGKPENVTSGEDMNKWCSRACERSKITELGKPIELHDFSKRLFNQPWKHEP